MSRSPFVKILWCLATFLHCMWPHILQACEASAIRSCVSPSETRTFVWSRVKPTFGPVNSCQSWLALRTPAKRHYLNLACCLWNTLTQAKTEDLNNCRIDSIDGKSIHLGSKSTTRSWAKRFICCYSHMSRCSKNRTLRKVLFKSIVSSTSTWIYPRRCIFSRHSLFS